MSRLFSLMVLARRTARLGGLAPIWLLAGACHLALSPSGTDETDNDEASVDARECGDQTCSEGNVCCNASCGICTAPGNVCIQIACEPSSEAATCKTLSCGAQETCMETPAGALCLADAESPCRLVDCLPNARCKVEQGAPVCVSPSAAGDAGAPVKKDAGAPAATDAGASADAGSPRFDAGGPAPVDAGTPALDASTAPDASAPELDAGQRKDTGISVPPSSCATVLCPTNTYCDDISGVAECIPLPSCATVRCSAGYHCELQQVQCIRAPCPPHPACVPNPEPKDPCDNKCKAGTHCQVTPIVCVTTPCDPIGECVPDRGGCGCSGKGACLDIICPAEY